MKIIILGAGRVGQSVAASLVSEKNDITVIDTDAQRLRELESRLDLRGVVGNGVDPQVLAEAGARDTDLVIACAAQDETNLVCCKVAQKLFGVPTRIARVRASGYEDGSDLLGPDGFAVDHILCPEDSLVRYIAKLVEYPGALQVRAFAGGRADVAKQREHVVGQQLAGVLHAALGLVTVVELADLDALPRHAALGVEGVKTELGARVELDAELRRRPGEGRRLAEHQAVALGTKSRCTQHRRPRHQGAETAAGDGRAHNRS